MSNISLLFFLFSEKSFNDIDAWLKDLKTNSSPDIKVFLIGNKCDMENARKVDTERAKKFKEDYNLDLFMETSAKLGTNVQQLFIEAARLLYNDYNKYKVRIFFTKQNPKKHNKKLNQNNGNDEENKKKCCK